MEFKIISSADVARCPLHSLSPEHYLREGGCKCYPRAMVIADGQVWKDSDGSETWPVFEAEALADALEDDGYEVTVVYVDAILTQEQVDATYKWADDFIRDHVKEGNDESR